MANPLAPHGFSPVISIQSNDWNAACHMYEIPSTDGVAYYIGDVVKPVALADTGNIWGTMGIAQVVKAAASDTNYLGVVVSVFRNPYALDQVFVPATKTQNYYVLVMDDPFAQFEVMANNTTTLATTVIGKNATFAVAAPTGISPVSATVLDVTTSGTGSTLPFRVLGIAQRINADNTANTPLIVTWNAHTFKSVGVTSV